MAHAQNTDSTMGGAGVLRIPAWQEACGRRGSHFCHVRQSRTWVWDKTPNKHLDRPADGIGVCSGSPTPRGTHTPTAQYAPDRLLKRMAFEESFSIPCGSGPGPGSGHDCRFPNPVDIAPILLSRCDESCRKTPIGRVIQICIPLDLSKQTSSWYP